MIDNYIYEYHDKDSEQIQLDITNGMLASDYLDSLLLPETTVYNLDDDMEVNYSLRPHEALRSAYEQYEKGNYNTWTYKLLKDYSFKLLDNRTLMLGNWCCLISGDKR